MVYGFKNDKSKAEIAIIEIESGTGTKSIPAKSSNNITFTIPSEYRSGYDYAICGIELIDYDSSDTAEVAIASFGYWSGSSVMYVTAYNYNNSPVVIDRALSEIKLLVIKK